MPAIPSQQRAAIITALQELRRILIRGPEQDFPEGVFAVANDPKFAKDKRWQRAVEFRLAAKAVQDALNLVGPVQYAPVELQGPWRILNADLYHLDHLPASGVTLRALQQSIEDSGGRKQVTTRVPLTIEDMTILEALAEEYPMAVTQPDLECATKIRRQKISERLKWLEAKPRRFVERPKGTQRKGHAITQRGLLAIGRLVEHRR
ncbi:MAG: hypothetical protein WCB27_06890 [Thermoguttaceae bacterium]